MPDLRVPLYKSLQVRAEHTLAIGRDIKSLLYCYYYDTLQNIVLVFVVIDNRELASYK